MLDLDLKPRVYQDGAVELAFVADGRLAGISTIACSVGLDSTHVSFAILRTNLPRLFYCPSTVVLFPPEFLVLA